jgi:hypothetical protein
MQLLNFVSLVISIFILGNSVFQFFHLKNRGLHSEESILVSIFLLAALNISIYIVMSRNQISCPTILSHLGFGAVMFQSILSLFILNYVKRNTKSVYEKD